MFNMDPWTPLMALWGSKSLKPPKLEKAISIYQPVCLYRIQSLVQKTENIINIRQTRMMHPFLFLFLHLVSHVTTPVSLMGMCSGIKLQIRRVVQASFGGSKPARIEAFFPDSYGTQRRKRGWCTSKLRIFTSHSCLSLSRTRYPFLLFYFAPCFCVGACESPPSCFNWLLSLHVRGPGGIVSNPPATIRPDAVLERVWKGGSDTLLSHRARL